MLEPSPDPLPKAKSPRAEQERILREALGSFPRFCGLLKVTPFDGGERIPLRLSPIQRAYNVARTNRDVVLKPRRVYMTTLEAARDVWIFLTKRAAHVTLLCQPQGNETALKNMAEMLRGFFLSLEEVGLTLDLETTTTAWSLPSRGAVLRIEQAGGSEIAATRKGRGGTIHRLHCTEVAFWGEYAKDTFAGMGPSVPPTGEIVMESTANGAGGFFFDQWRAAVEGRSTYRPHFFEWWKHPAYHLPAPDFRPRDDRERALLTRGVSPAALAWYRWILAENSGDEQKVAQEYPSDPDSCFLVSGRTFFDAVRTKAMADAASVAEPPTTFKVVKATGQLAPVAPGDLDELIKFDTVRVFHAPDSGGSYVVALDPSEGTGGDPAPGIVLERGTGRHMATIWGQFTPIQLARVAVVVAREFRFATVAFERNNHGGSVRDALGPGWASLGLSWLRRPYPRVFVDADGKLGWNNTGPSRTAALDNLQEAHLTGAFSTLDTALLGELRTFIVNAAGRAEGARGTHDDLVMATCIAWDVICRQQPADHGELPRI